MFSLDLCGVVCGYAVCAVATKGAQPILLRSFEVWTQSLLTQTIAVSPLDGSLWLSSGSRTEVRDAHSDLLFLPDTADLVFVRGVAINERGVAFVASIAAITEFHSDGQIGRTFKLPTQGSFGIAINKDDSMF